MAIHFRRATIFDAPAMAEIFEPEVPNGHFHGFGDKAAVTVFNSMIAHRSVGIHSAIGQVEVPISSWVAIENNNVVGFFVNKPWIDYKETQAKINSGIFSATTLDVELWILAVRGNARGKGVGLACLKSQIADAKQLARSRGNIYARCYSVSTRAIEMLKLSGFREQQADNDGVVFRYQR